MFLGRKFYRWWVGLQRRVRHGAGPARSAPLVEDVLRSRLLSAEQMVLHGQSLARGHRLQPRSHPELLLTRLRENEVLLDEAATFLTRMVQDDIRVTPAGEWLLDNHYLLQEQIRTARRHLPRGYSRELPTLSHGPSARLPRVYDLAMTTIAHGDGRIDAETASRFVAAYQSVTPLTLGELWAIPIMLRLALIENLRRMSVRVMRDGVDRRLAGSYVTRRLLIFCLLIAFGTGAAAGPDVETQCLDCHRAAQRRGDVPLIEGQHREYLEHQLLRFRERHRDSFPMSAFTGGMDDASLRALAAVLAARPWRGTDARASADARERGAAAALRRDCAGCHGLQFQGSGDIARLAGQDPGYLARQIEGFGRGSRYHPPSGTGAPMRDITPAEAQDLAAYFSAIDTATASDDDAAAE